MSSIVFVIIGGAALAGGIGVFGWWALPARRRPGLPLVGTVLVSMGVLALVTAWVMTDRTINRGEALKTGGLAAGAVVALYALWLNDRRRRVEERRQEIERERTDHDRERVADERFARAVELLGNDADQVRVGALHALAGLARNRSAYTQTVLDVFCAYLRVPFNHYRHEKIRGQQEEDWEPERRDAADRELQVRRTAQVLISDLLPHVSEVNAPVYDLDLHAATLEYFDISERVFGELRARQANLYETNSFWGSRIRGPVWFTGTNSWGRFYAHDIDFADRSWFSKFQAHGHVRLDRNQFHGDVKFSDANFRGPVTFAETVFEGEVELQRMSVSGQPTDVLPPGWAELVRSPSAGLT
jgi:hypothetical protein